jgi:hypothetical protein
MSDKINLQLNLQPGDVFKNRSTVEQHIREMIENNPLEMDQVIIIDYGYQVLGLDNKGNIGIQVTYDGIGFIQDGPMGHLEYKSWENSEEIPAMAQGFASVVGQSFTMTVSDSWEIIAIDGLDEMVERMIDNLEISETMLRAQVKESFNNQFGDEAMKETMEQMFAFYPELPVRNGDTWCNALTLKKGFPMLLETQYELVEFTDNEIRVDLASSIKPGREQGPTQFNGILMRYNVHGQQNGYLIIDRTSGWLKKMEMDQSFHGQVQISEPSGTTHFRFPLDVSSKITTELIK